MRPASLLLHGPTTGDWSEADRKLATALSIDKQSRCPCGCGFYRDETIGEDNEGHFVAEGVVCWASHAREKYNARDRVRPHGELVSVRRLRDGEDDDVED